MRIVTDYKHAQQIIVELDAEVERLTARLIAESGEVEDLVNRLQESEDDNGRLMKRIAKLEAELERVRMNSVRPAHRRANSEGENNE